MTRMTRLYSFAFATLTLAAPLGAQQTPPQTGAHHLDASGKQAMGFDQQSTTHHFVLYEDGGAVEVSVKDKTDKTNMDAIRSHLPHIAMMFGEGNFDAPMMVHDSKDVPGVAALAKLKGKVKYTYAETPAGGRVDIVTTDKDALAAVHAFLKFQIKDHETGDKTNVMKRKN